MKDMTHFQIILFIEWLKATYFVQDSEVIFFFFPFTEASTRPPQEAIRSVNVKKQRLSGQADVM